MRVKDARQTFLGIWIKKLIDEEPIQVFGDGLQIRDFTYVDDCVEAFLRAAAADGAAGQIFNLGSDETINLRNLAALMVEISGGGNYELVPFPADRKTIDIGDYYGDYRMIQGRLGWRPAVQLRAGLERTLVFYRENRTYYW
jgi:UDP-glucose 4-epimerase